MTPDKPDAGNPATPYQRMLRVACAHILASGQRPTIDAVAPEAAVDPAAARAMFDDDAALLAAVMENTLVLLTDEITRATTAAQPEGDPVAQFRALLIAAIDWSAANPNWSALFLHSELFRSQKYAYRRYNDALREMALNMLRRAEAEGRLAGNRKPEEVEVTCRAMVWGLMSMAVQRRLKRADTTLIHSPVSTDICHHAMDSLLDALLLPAPEEGAPATA